VSGESLKLLQEEVNSKMATILRTRTLRGCPINIPFSDIEDVMSQVNLSLLDNLDVHGQLCNVVVYQIKALRIHESKHPEVQFVMAARAFPIANNLISLWVFIGTLETGGN
jgi:hypothetical protein